MTEAEGRLLKHSRTWMWPAAVMVGLAVVIAAVAVPRLRPADPATLTVMTRNLYLGACLLYTSPSPRDRS